MVSPQRDARQFVGYVQTLEQTGELSGDLEQAYVLGDTPVIVFASDDINETTLPAFGQLMGVANGITNGPRFDQMVVVQTPPRDDDEGEMECLKFTIETEWIDAHDRGDLDDEELIAKIDESERPFLGTDEDLEAIREGRYPILDE